MERAKNGMNKQTGGQTFTGVGCHFDDITKSKMYNKPTTYPGKEKREIQEKSVIERRRGEIMRYGGIERFFQCTNSRHNI